MRTPDDNRQTLREVAWFARGTYLLLIGAASICISLVALFTRHFKSFASAAVFGAWALYTGYTYRRDADAGFDDE